MKVIQPNCRVQFTAEDIDFILSVLRPKVGNAECLVKLLTDEESRDLILDDEALLRAVLEHRSCLRISAHFYFYIRSEEHTSELQSHHDLVCRLLLEKKKKKKTKNDLQCHSTTH